MTVALIYTRVSSDEQAREGLSLDAQLTECRRYAAQQGWIIGGEHQDVLTGTRDDRPQYQQLLTTVRALRAGGSPAVVVVAVLDRFGRRLLERVRSREELKTLGVAVHSVREGGEVSDLVANVLGAVAQEEVRRIGERVKGTRAYVIGSGWWPVTRAPWGLALRPASEDERRSGSPVSVLRIDEVAGPYVVDAYQRVADGASVRSVFLWINGLPAELLGGRKMPFAQVRDMLSRPVYVARPDHGDPDVLARPKGRWPALISDDLHRRVQQQIKRHTVLPRQASGSYLLTGMLVCPRCGGRVNGDFYRHQYRYYRCAGHSNATQSGADLRCIWTAPCAPIDTAVLEEVGILLEALSADASTLKAAWDELVPPTDLGKVRAQRIAALEREKAKAQTRLKDAALKLVDGDLDKAGYGLVRDAAQGALATAEAEITRLKAAPERELPTLEAVLTSLPSWQGALADASIPVQREVLRPLIERVVPVWIARGHYTTDIAWTSLGTAVRDMSEATALRMA